MTAAWSDQLRADILESVRILAGPDVSSTDFDYARELCAAPAEAIGDDQWREAWRMLDRYGTSIPRPPGTPDGHKRDRRVRDMLRWIELVDDRFVIHYPFNQHVLDAVRALPGREFNLASKIWSVPLDQTTAVHRFAGQFGFAMTNGAKAAPPPPPAPPNVDVRSGFITIGIRRLGRRAIDDVKALPTQTFDTQRNEWRIPAYMVRPVRRIASTHQLTTSEAFDQLPDADPNRIVVTAELDGDHVLLWLPPRSDTTELIKGYGRWESDRKCWTVPIAMIKAVARAFAKAGLELDLTAVQDELDRLSTNRALSEALDGDFVIRDGWVGPELLPHQRAAQVWLAQHRFTLIADPVGLGKTITALAHAWHRGLFPMVILCEGTLTDRWAREIGRCLPQLEVQTLAGETARSLVGGMLPPADVIVCSYDIAWAWVKELAKLRARLVVCDESHLVKNQTARRTRRIIDYAHTIDRATGSILCMTGTPCPSNRVEYACQLDVLGRVDEFGGKAGIAKDADIAERLRAAGAMLRREKQKVQPGLPPAIHDTVVLTVDQLDPDGFAEYQKAEANIAEYLAQRALERAKAAGDPDPLSAANKARIRAKAAEHLVAIAVLKGLAVKAKLPAVQRWVDRFLDSSGEKFLLFGHTVEPLDQAEAAHPGCLRIKAGQKSAERMAICDRFQDPAGPQLMILGMMTGSRGLDLTAAENCGFIELGWTPGGHDQGIGRMHGRLNDPHGAMAHYFVAEDTLDLWNVDLLNAKRVEVGNAVDGIIVDADDLPESKTSVLGDLVVMLTEKGMQAHG
jgi:SWI/SNF-related matrix-associated actin-dependent regulator 1 of chromatin subfamily A